jgi:hypothetical protein
MNVAQALAERDAWKAQGDWVPANGRTETSFMTHTGRRLLYCYPAAQRAPRLPRHGH